jgi:hypothetical protein
VLGGEDAANGDAIGEVGVYTRHGHGRDEADHVRLRGDPLQLPPRLR